MVHLTTKKPFFWANIEGLPSRGRATYDRGWASTQVNFSFLQITFKSFMFSHFIPLKIDYLQISLLKSLSFKYTSLLKQ